MDYIVRRISVHYDSESFETMWVLFEHGNLAHPMVVLTDLQMQSLIDQVKQQKKRKQA